MEPIVSGQGAAIELRDGRTLVDLCSQTLNLNLGQCHPAVMAAVTDQMSRLTYTSSRFSNVAAEQLTDKLVQITPPSLVAVNLKCVSGSDANECALKAVRKATGRLEVISFLGSHHGQTFESMRISGKNFDLPYLGERHTHFVDAPNCYRCPVGKKPATCSAECLDAAEDVLRRHRVTLAAVFIEPILVDAGVLKPPLAFHRRLRELCSTYGVALVYDEVQTAFGWLGAMFAMDLYGTHPDVLTLAKGLGAGFPIGAAVFSREYDVLEYGEHEITYGAHPVSATAALAMLAVLEGGELAAVRRLGEYVAAELERLHNRFPRIGDVRGCGLLWGIEIVDPATGAPDARGGLALFEEMVRRGFLLRISKVGQHSNVLQFKPPLVITEGQLERFFAALEEALSEWP